MIYFIKTKDHPYVKIGFTNDSDAERRRASLQTACPFELEILNFYKGSEDLEKELHQKFGDSRLHGEWFFWSEEIQAWLQSDNGMSPVWYPDKPLKMSEIKNYVRERLKYDKEKSCSKRRVSKRSQERLEEAAEYLETNFPKEGR